MAAMMTSGSCVTSGDLTTVIIIDLVESSQGDQRETAAHDEEHEEEDWGTSVESERWAIRERWETLKRNGYKWTYLNDPALQARFLQRNIVLDDDVYFFIHREKFNFKKDFTPKSLGEDMWMSVKDAWRHWDKVNRLEAFKRFVPPSTPADFTATPSVMEAAIAYVVTPPSPLADASAIQHTSPVIKRPRITKENIDQPQIVSIKTVHTHPRFPSQNTT